MRFLKEILIRQQIRFCIVSAFLILCSTHVNNKSYANELILHFNRFQNIPTAEELYNKLTEVTKSIDNYIWKKFYNRHTQNLQTTVTGDLQDNTLYGSLYLACLVDAYRVTNGNHYKEKARKIFAGLYQNATVSGIPGFVARATRENGTYLADPSVDQYTGLLYGFWRYYSSSFCTEEDQIKIRDIYENILSRLEKHNWTIKREDGIQQTKWGGIDIWRPGWVLLSYLLAGYHVTGNVHWLDLYHTELDTRLPSGGDWISTKAWVRASWVAIQTQICLQMLVQLEKDTEIQKKYSEAMLRLSLLCQSQVQFFDEVPPRNSNSEVLLPYYLRGPKTKYVKHVRIPLEAVTVMLLANDSSLVPVATNTLTSMNNRIDLKRVEYTTTVVPWEWNNWLLLIMLDKEN